MTSLSLEEIVKWALIIMIAGIALYLVYILFFPEASGMFWEKINNATGIFKIGKEKMDYEFEIPESMKNNIKAVKTTILELNKQEQATEPAQVTKKELTFEGFEECELTFETSSKGNLRMVIKTNTGQLVYYEIETEKPYKPCIVMFSNKAQTEFKKENMMYPSTIKIVEILSGLQPPMLYIKALFKDNPSNDKDFIILKNDEYNIDKDKVEYKVDMYRIDDDICFAGYYN